VILVTQKFSFFLSHTVIEHDHSFHFWFDRTENNVNVHKICSRMITNDSHLLLRFLPLPFYFSQMFRRNSNGDCRSFSLGQVILFILCRHHVSRDGSAQIM